MGSCWQPVLKCGWKSCSMRQECVLPRKWSPAGGNGLGFIAAGNDWHILISKMLLTHWLIFLLGFPSKALFVFQGDPKREIFTQPHFWDWCVSCVPIWTFVHTRRSFWTFVDTRRSSTQVARIRTAAQSQRPSTSAMSGRTTAWYRASTQVAGHPHEYQEDAPLSLSSLWNTWSGGGGGGNIQTSWLRNS